MIYCCVYRSVQSNILVARDLVYVKDEEEKKSLLDTDRKIDSQGCEKFVLEMDNLDFMERIDITRTNIGCIAIIREEDSNGAKTYSKHDISIEEIEEYLKRECGVILLNLTMGIRSSAFPEVTMRKIYTLKEHMK